jgi:hypothetical protein
VVTGVDIVSPEMSRKLYLSSGGIFFKHQFFANRAGCLTEATFDALIEFRGKLNWNHGLTSCNGPESVPLQKTARV